MLDKIINFFNRHIILKIIGTIIVIFIIVFGTITFLFGNILLSLYIDFENRLTVNLITTIGLTSSIISLINIIQDTSSLERKQIQKQNEEMKTELAEIKNMIAEQPKRYSVEIREIKD